jgi:hypothetical protein
MSDSGLTRCLRDGLTPSQWYELLNRKVFFWLTTDRLERLLGANAYRDHEHTILTIDTSSLLARYADQALLSPINSGCTKPYPHPRGLTTFQPLGTYPFAAYDRARSRKDPAVELAVEGGIPDVREFVLTVEERRAGNPGRTLWQR